MLTRRILKKYFSKSKELIEMELKYGCHNYAPIPVMLERGEGLRVWDINGKEYFDCLAAYSAVNQGHCHPKIRAAMVEQSGKLCLTSRAFHNNLLGLWTKRVADTFNHDRVIFSNSGVEACETAVKFARRWGYDVKGIPKDSARVLFANENFWGRTLAACGSSDDPDRYRNFGPFNGMGFDLIDYNDTDQLEEMLSSNPNYAAFMIEPIQGEAGVKIPDKGYLRKCREICDKYNVLLIMDEVQTGIGRTGELLCYEGEEGTKPDILTLGKSLSGGFYPISATLATNEVMDCIKPGEHGSTFGGNPLACAIGQAALDVVFEENMVENSKEIGKYFLEGLAQIEKPFIKDLRGQGLMIGMEFDHEWEYSAKKVCLALMEEGMLCKQTHDNIIRFSPPLIVKKEEVDTMLGMVDKVLNKMNH